MIDFAGSGVVHMVGGFAGLVGAIALGPRIGRFNADGVLEIPGTSNIMMQSLGTFILWFGWIGFNAGSTLAVSGGSSALAGKVATTTIIAASCGGIGGTAISVFTTSHFDMGLILNSILAALVSITASCAVVGVWQAACIGFIGSIVYVLASKLLLILHIDDPLDAWPVHGACGFWGVLSVGVFGTMKDAAFGG